MPRIKNHVKKGEAYDAFIRWVNGYSLRCWSVVKIDEHRYFCYHRDVGEGFIVYLRLAHYQPKYRLSLVPFKMNDISKKYRLEIE